MDFASRSGRIKKYTVVAAYSGKDWPKENKNIPNNILNSKQNSCHIFTTNALTSKLKDLDFLRIKREIKETENIDSI